MEDEAKQRKEQRAERQKAESQQRAAREKHDAEKELLRQAAEGRMAKPTMPSNEDIDGLFDELSLHFSEVKKSENAWRAASISLIDLECTK
jgi:hypothetical protein